MYMGQGQRDGPVAGNGTHQYVKWGVAVEAGRLIQALERGWALGRHHVGAGVLLVGNCLAAYPPPMLDPPPAVLQIH